MSSPVIDVWMAFGSAPLATSPSWTSIHSGAAGSVRRLSLTTGRTDPRNQVSAATGRLLLKDTSSAFDRRNTASPYYPDVTTMVQVKAQATINSTTYDLMRQFVERWPRVLRTPQYVEWAPTTVDAFELLQAASLAGASYSAESTGTRVGNVLDTIGWPAGQRDIDTGYSTIPAVAFAADDETSALQHLLAITGPDGEGGLFYIAPNGKATFRDRRKVNGSAGTSQAVFSDTIADAASAGGYPFQRLKPVTDKDTVVNYAAGTRSGGSTQTATDSSSISAQSKRASVFTSQVKSDTEVLAQAQARVGRNKDPLDYIEQLTLNPGNDTAYWQAVLGLSLGDRITIREKPPGFSAYQQADYVIQQITASFEPGPTTSATYDLLLFPAALFAYFRLDHAVLGTLDSGNKLNY